MLEAVEPIEAVIISGPRRGEIVRLPEEAIPELSDAEIEALNQALDELIAALDRYSAEVRSTIEVWRGPTEAT